MPLPTKTSARSHSTYARLAIRTALQAPAVASTMQRDGYIPDNRDVTETAAYFRKEVELMGDAVKAAGIEAN